MGEGVHPDTVMVMRHAGSNADSLIAKVGDAAKLTVSDPGHGKSTPGFATWQPYSPSMVDGLIDERPPEDRPSKGDLSAGHQRWYP
jgi:hypothetical protein